MHGRWFVVAGLLTATVSASSLANTKARPEQGATHTVESGQSLWLIAQEHGCTVADLQAANELKGAELMPGQMLVVPACKKDSPVPIVAGPGQKLHTVESGQSLWDIGQQYGCTTTDLQHANQLTGATIMPGQALVVPNCAAGPVQGPTLPPTPHEVTTEVAKAMPEAAAADKALGELLAYRVRPGDSLYTIARRHDTSVIDIRLRNGLDSNTIFAGQTLDLLPGSGSDSGRPIPGQSVGRPQRGKLRHASVLASAPYYYIRRPQRAFGAHHVVHHVKRVASMVKRKYPKIHKLAIGDISAKKGGRISGHASHQSGRDVDFGLYYKKVPRSYPKEFVEPNPKNLDTAATWALVSALAATAELPGGVDRLFIGYRTQKLLYNYARKKGVPVEKLRKWFQYPNGRNSMTGIIRHEPYHDDHIHARFKCPPEDSRCDA